MQQLLKDTLGLGFLFWLIGYLGGIVLYLTPLAGIMGWVLALVMTPLTAGVTYWYFRNRTLPLSRFALVGIAWAAIAIILDYLFIVQLFHPAAYYQADVLLYYAVMFIIPVLIGWYLLGRNRTPEAGA